MFGDEQDMNNKFLMRVSFFSSPFFLFFFFTSFRVRLSTSFKQFSRATTHKVVNFSDVPFAFIKQATV